MKALSLWQPWASLVAIGVKPHETRSWAPPLALIGKRFAIHAAKKSIDEATAGLTDGVMEAMVRALIAAGEDPMNLPHGKVVCTVVLGDPGRVESRMRTSTGLHAVLHNGSRVLINHFGDYAVGRWVWPLLDVERVTPYDVIGRQGLFDLDVATGAVHTPMLFGR
mgnify:CR=1 FL=1